MTNFSTNLKYLRKERKLSQQEIADSIGIKQRTYSYYETGYTEPNIDVLTKLARYFRVSLDYLVGFAFDFGSSEEEKAHFNELSRRTGITKGEMLIEGVIHAPEIVKAKLEGREVEPQNERMTTLRKTSREIKNSNN